MAMVPPLIAWWAIYGTQIIISLSFMAVSMGLNLALAYLNKPKTTKSIFDSDTYHADGMINNIQPGTPKNIVFGKHRIAPAFISRYSFAHSDEIGKNNHTDMELLCSLGEETTGVWDIRVNDESVFSSYPGNAGNDDEKGLRMWWAPGGHSNQLIYRSRNIKRGTLSGLVSKGYDKTINFDYINGNDTLPFQTATAALPGYVLINEDGDTDSFEIIKYTGISANGGAWKLTGCIVTKDHTAISKIRQEWTLAYKKGDTTPLSIMPPFQKVVAEQQNLSGGNGILIENPNNAPNYGAWTPSTPITTNTKVRGFAVTVAFEKGLYWIDHEKGYRATSVPYQIRWRKVGGTWDINWTWTPGQILHDTANTALYIKINKYDNYAIVVNSDGSTFTDFMENFSNYGLDYKIAAAHQKFRRWKLEFDGTKERYPYHWILPKEPDSDIKFEYVPYSEETFNNPSNDQLEPKYYCKITWATSDSNIYDGQTREGTNRLSFQITYESGTESNLLEGLAKPKNAMLASYRLTHRIPLDEPLEYAKYEIQVRKLHSDIEDPERGQNEMRWLTLQEIDNDVLEYPFESLLGFRLKMNEKINTTIDNITCMVQGKAMIDVQNASNVRANATAYSQGVFIRPTVHNGTFYRCLTAGTTGGSEPTWPDIGTVSDGTATWEVANRFSDNPIDICSDLIMSKRFGRGKYLELTNDRITAWYDKIKLEAAFADENITENAKPRKRFSLNFNLDFRGPLIDLLQSLGNTFRGKFYFDGEIPVCYIDRKKTPTAMFCMGNIIEDTYKPDTLNLTDNINRIYAQFLNGAQNYKQDTEQADIISINSTWTIAKLIDKSISLYGLTKKWYVRKILNWMLRFAWYTRNSNSFSTTLDGLSCDIGDTYYCHDDTMNLTAQSGRILAFGSNYIDMDKPFTFVVNTTYKALLRKDNGQPHTELTVDGAATGYGAKTRVYFTASFTSVSKNSVYILGLSGNYYMTFRCVQRVFKGSRIEFVSLEYNDEIYRIYKNDTSDPAWTGDTDESTNNKDDKKSSNVPPKIPQMVLVESRSNFGVVEVHIRPPEGSLIWHHADIYYRLDNTENDYTYVGATRGEPLQTASLRIGKKYSFRAVSIGQSGLANTNVTTAIIVITGKPDRFKPKFVTGIQLIGSKGEVTNVSGSDFEFKWDRSSKISGDDSTSNYLKHAGISNAYENDRYLITVYFPDIPVTIKHNEILVRDKIVHQETTTENHYRFRLAQNIEAMKDLWAQYSTHPSYATYYGKPNRTCRFVIQTINGYGNISDPMEQTFTNPAPNMNNSIGANTTPVLKALKSGVRVQFIHPYQEYDISHFMVQYAEDAAFTVNLKKVRVSSAITVNSTDDELDSTQYKVDIDGLDPKKTYHVKIRPHDTYGAGTYSGTASIKPGVTDDDANSDIAYPAQVSGVTVALNSNNNVIVSWTKSADIDVTKIIIDWRASQFTGTPILTLTSVGGNIPILGEVDQGYLNSDNTKPVIGEKRSVEINLDESESHSKDSIIIKGAKAGYTYFVRVRFENSSRKQGAWSLWKYNETAVTGISDDDFAFRYKKAWYTGKIADTSYRRATWTGVTMKVAKSGGGTTNYSITNGNTGDLATDGTGARWIVWRSDYLSGTVFDVIDDNALATDVTYKDAVSVAYVIPTNNTDGKITIIPTLGTKSDTITSSAIIAANSILANHIKVINLAAINSILGSITAGDLTLAHDGGGFIKFKDSAGRIAIRMRVNSGSDPDLVIMKSGENADNGSDDTDPSKVAFSSKLTVNAVTLRASYKKVVDEFIYTIPDNANWQNKTIAAETIEYAGTVYISGANFPSGYGITLPREVAGLIFVGNASATDCREPSWGSTVDGTDSCYEYVQINFRTSGGQGLVRLDRVCVNPTGGSLTLPSMVGVAIKITVYADLVG